MSQGSTPPRSGDLAALRERATNDTIVELVGLFAHDLSNPLQSLTVLLELALDDAPPESEAYARMRQGLDATERMRRMIREFSGMARTLRAEAGRMTIQDSFGRILPLLQRRLDRHQVRVRLQLGEVGALLSPLPALEMAFLTLVMGVITTAAESDLAAFQLVITGSLPTKYRGDVARVELGLLGHRHADETFAGILIEPARVARAADLVAGSGVSILAHPNLSVRVDLPNRAGGASG